MAKEANEGGSEPYRTNSYSCLVLPCHCFISLNIYIYLGQLAEFTTNGFQHLLTLPNENEGIGLYFADLQSKL